MKTFKLANLASFLIEPGLEPPLYAMLIMVAGVLIMFQQRRLAMAIFMFIFASILLPVLMEPILTELFLMLPPGYEWLPGLLFNGLLICLVIGVLIPRSVRNQVLANLLTLAIIGLLRLPFRVLRSMFQVFRT